MGVFIYCCQIGVEYSLEGLVPHCDSNPLSNPQSNTPVDIVYLQSLRSNYAMHLQKWGMNEPI